MSKKKFTPKQQLFISEYLVDQNATQAYLRASPKVSEKVAAAAGARMLRNVPPPQNLWVEGGKN